ncbi:MAG: molybdopterin molybdotransferase MoeA [Actinomycetota bacterium]|nr:molybdopterin molybdotransferase MoeA [Actinomycetota bacterium]
MTPLAEALALVLDRCPRRPPSEVPLADALGTVLARAVEASEAVPPFDNSAMDGFAVRCSDTRGATPDRPVTLRVVATLAAGAAPDRAVEPGEAVRIMTGAPMPVGADAIVMVERTKPAGDGQVHIEVEVPDGLHVRRIGGDIAAGAEVLPVGTILGPAHLGVAASVGSRRLTVHPSLRVGVLSTGDELVEGDEPLRPGQIRESNRPMLLALVRRAGCEPIDLGLVADDEAGLTDALRHGASTCDALITSGGVSMGDFDVVRTVLDRIAAMTWLQIAIKPAKPFAFGIIDGTPVFGLPGNPVSSLVSFELLARPALRHMMGHEHLDRPRLTGQAAAELRRTEDGRVHYMRVHARWSDGVVLAMPVIGQGSHQLAASAGANALAVVPDGDGVPVGGAVDLLLLGDLETAPA